MDMLSQFDSNKTTAFQTMEEERQERVKSELYKEAMVRGMDQRLMQGMQLPEMQSGEQLERDIRAF